MPNYFWPFPSSGSSISINHQCYLPLDQRTLTYFARRSITVRLTSSLTDLDSTILVNLYLIQHEQSSWMSYLFYEEVCLVSWKVDSGQSYEHSDSACKQDNDAGRTSGHCKFAFKRDYVEFNAAAAATLVHDSVTRWCNKFFYNLPKKLPKKKPHTFCIILTF